jgi:hypothetical protein
VAAPIAALQVDVRADMRSAVERNDTNAMHQLVADHHGIAALKDLQVVVVGRAEHRWAFVPPRDAALAERSVLDGVGRASAACFGRTCGRSFLSVRRQRRYPAICRLEN